MRAGPISYLRIWMSGSYSLEDLNPPLFLRLDVSHVSSVSLFSEQIRLKYSECNVSLNQPLRS